MSAYFFLLRLFIYEYPAAAPAAITAMVPGPDAVLLGGAGDTGAINEASSYVVSEVRRVFG